MVLAVLPPSATAGSGAQAPKPAADYPNPPLWPRPHVGRARPPGGSNLQTPAKVVDVEGFTLVLETVTPVLRCWEQAPVLPSLSDPLRTADFPRFRVPGPRTIHNSSGALPYWASPNGATQVELKRFLRRLSRSASAGHACSQEGAPATVSPGDYLVKAGGRSPRGTPEPLPPC